ncbi:hypothetical protein QR680_005809 [Steinernema hermaphroditum]|uniref:Ubiquitin carboxyl-terminal hydrolase 39 n=1 Tax=Steinernema hermaphroditum TaxID=289476 RepID=A0AA39HTF9_9BILA|nr:hypothetical protein QR680_005809 [Steinernema hermaphroditum]
MMSHRDDESSSSRRTHDRDRDRERDRHDRDRMNGRDHRERDDRGKDRKRQRSPERPSAKRGRRDASPERRSSRRDDNRERDRDRRRSRSPRRSPEPGEVVEGASKVEDKPVERPLTAREIARQKLLQEIEEQERADESNAPMWTMKKAEAEKASRNCPYLDTVDRAVLDFDFEKLCSISLSHVNVYACMVCGKYFQGRGMGTHAYTHSVDTNHHVFLNLQSLKFYCLPDNYEVIDPSLSDIKFVLKPFYKTEEIEKIDKNTRMSRAFDDTRYYPGIVGLNNIKANDYTNVILHALSHVPPLRDYFLREEDASLKRPPGDKLNLLPKRFGELIRKLWNPKVFKAHVSPHEMLQAVVLCSNKRFQITKQSDAQEFMLFLLNTLHIALNGTKKTSSSIVYRCFRGKMRVYSRKVLPMDADDSQRRAMMESDEFSESVEEKPFLYLNLDLPPPPLYRDELLQNIIPQVPLGVLLARYNGSTEKECKTYNENFLKRFELTRLPEYLILTYQRFEKNRYFMEKNPTIVNFPITNVDFYDCLAPEARETHKYTTYDLVANIVHDGPPSDGHYRMQVVHQATGKWYELEDLHVTEILPQIITLTESYIQIWRLNTKKTRVERMGEEEMDTV